jgi:hypothetical protein
MCVEDYDWGCIRHLIGMDLEHSQDCEKILIKKFN